MTFSLAGSRWLDVAESAIVVVFLAASIWWAARAHRRAASGSGWIVRVAVTDCACSAALMADFLVGALKSRDAPMRLPALFGIATAFTLIVIGVLILLIELIAWRLRPVRTARWLGLSLALFLVIFFAAFGAPMWLKSGGLRGFGLLVTIQISGLFAATSLIWWSYLPAVGAPVARQFE